MRRSTRSLVTSLVVATVASACPAVACSTFLDISGDVPVEPPPPPGVDGSGDAAPIDGDAAGPDAEVDAEAGVADVFDAGCGAVVAMDFSSATLPGQVTEISDPGSTVVYDLSGVGGTRAMHVTVPLGNTTAGLVVNVQALGRDGAKACAISCGFDVKLVQRGAAAIELTMAGSLASGSANISHSSTFTYFSRSGNGVEAPDLGTLGQGVFTHTAIDISPAPSAPFTGRGAVSGMTSTKPLAFFPVSAHIGIEKLANDPTVEAVVDNVLCRSRLP